MSTDLRQVGRREDVHISRQPGVERQEIVTEDVDARRRQTVERVSELIGLLFWVLEGMIGLRILLRLMEANPNNAFARFLYNLTAIFLVPFAGLFGNPTVGGAVLEITSIIAMIVYALIAWALIRLVWLLFYQPSARMVSTYQQDQPSTDKIK